MTTRLDPLLGFTLPDGTTQSTAAYSGFGYYQKWTTFTPTVDRFANTTYSNDTGLPIALNVCTPSTRGYSFSIVVNGVPTSYCYQDSVGGNIETMGTVIVPIGGTYAVTGSTPSYWYELR